MGEKYDQCVHTMKCPEGKCDNGAAWIYLPSYDETLDPWAPMRIEIVHLFTKDQASGYGTPFTDPLGRPHRQWPHTHYCAEMYILMGTDPENPMDLGGKFELWIGAGKEAEKFVIDKTTVIHIPAGVAHLPFRVLEVERPFIMVAMPMAPGFHDKEQIEELPPGIEAPPWALEKYPELFE